MGELKRMNEQNILNGLYIMSFDASLMKIDGIHEKVHIDGKFSAHSNNLKNQTNQFHLYAFRKFIVVHLNMKGKHSGIALIYLSI